MKEIERSLGMDSPPPSMPADLRAGGRRRHAAGSWLIGPMILAAVAAGMRVVFRGPDEIFTACFAVLLGLGLVWILVSALFPARADRTCPSCSGRGLERLDPESTHGLVCRLCGWNDGEASAFLLAEEEGPLEDIVLRERGDPPRRF